jgi:phosphatidylserine decarboxylase
MLSIHREGKEILRNSFLFLLLLNLVLIKGLDLNPTLTIIPIIISALLYLWMLYFFRNPTRNIIPQGESVLAPADGKVVVVEKVYEGEYFKADRIQVSIFMSPFNVHVNRSPIAGVLTYYQYHPGKYLVAFHPKSSTKNERTTSVVQRNDGYEILFRQIAGFMARRIKFYPPLKTLLQQGEEIGFIKFGSRLDLFLPLNSMVHIKLGDQVQAGLSVIAKLPSHKAL